MAKNDTITCAGRSWTRLTDDAIDSLRAQSDQAGYYQVTTDTTAPEDTSGAILLSQNTIIMPDMPLIQLFPGVLTSSTEGYLWFYPLDSGGASVSVSYA